MARQIEGKMASGFWTSFGVLYGILAFVTGLYGVLLHLFTVVSVWTVDGPFLGIIAFPLVGIAEVYLLFRAAAVNPLGWENGYTGMLIGFVLLVIISQGTVFLAALLSPKNEAT